MKTTELRAALEGAPDDADIILMMEGDIYSTIEVKPERQTQTEGSLDGVDYNVVFLVAR